MHPEGYAGGARDKSRAEERNKYPDSLTPEPKPGKISIQVVDLALHHSFHSNQNLGQHRIVGKLSTLH
jgi:hypothetical protein